MKYGLVYVASFVAFIIIDFIWLGIVTRNFYREQIGHLMAESVNWLPAIVFYLAFVVGILVFAVFPGLEANSIGKTLVLAALFGAISYATYDLSNFATLKN